MLGLFKDEDARLAEERDCAKDELIVSLRDGVEVEVEEDIVFWNVFVDVLVALDRRIVAAGARASYEEEVEVEIEAEVVEEVGKG